MESNLYKLNNYKNINNYNVKLVELEKECAICLLNKTQFCILHNNNNHLICYDCFNILDSFECPFCRENINKIDNNIDNNNNNNIIDLSKYSNIVFLSESNDLMYARPLFNPISYSSIKIPLLNSNGSNLMIKTDNVMVDDYMKDIMHNAMQKNNDNGTKFMIKMNDVMDEVMVDDYMKDIMHNAMQKNNDNGSILMIKMNDVIDDFMEKKYKVSNKKDFTIEEDTRLQYIKNKLAIISIKETEIINNNYDYNNNKENYNNKTKSEKILKKIEERQLKKSKNYNKNNINYRKLNIKKNKYN